MRRTALPLVSVAWKAARMAGRRLDSVERAFKRLIRGETCPGNGEKQGCGHGALSVVIPGEVLCKP